MPCPGDERLDRAMSTNDSDSGTFRLEYAVPALAVQFAPRLPCKAVRLGTGCPDADPASARSNSTTVRTTFDSREPLSQSATTGSSVAPSIRTVRRASRSSW